MIFKKVILFFSILFGIISCNGQPSLKAEYSLKVMINEDQLPEKMPQEIREEFKSFNRGDNKFKYRYEYGNNLSKFELIYKLDNSQGQYKNIIEQIKNQDRYPLYKDLFNKIFYKTYLVETKKFNIKDSLEKIHWEIEKNEGEVNKILNYKVKKAKGYFFNNGKKELVEAWYSEDIKISDGPDRYSGLPGLILKLKYDSRQSSMTYQVESIDILNEDEIKIELPTKNLITMKKFFEELDKINQIKKSIDDEVDKD